MAVKGLQPFSALRFSGRYTEGVSPYDQRSAWRQKFSHYYCLAMDDIGHAIGPDKGRTAMLSCTWKRPIASLIIV